MIKTTFKSKNCLNGFLKNCSTSKRVRYTMSNIEKIFPQKSEKSLKYFLYLLKLLINSK
ncbi:hypothetical protein ES703_45556 [subsurface metagenome]